MPSFGNCLLARVKLGEVPTVVFINGLLVIKGCEVSEASLLSLVEVVESWKLEATEINFGQIERIDRFIFKVNLKPSPSSSDLVFEV